LISLSFSGSTPGKMEHTVAHDLGRAVAKRATQAAIDSYTKRFSQYKPQATWTDDYKATVGMNVKGIHLDGKIEVRDNEIAMNLDVPFVLRPFRSRAIQIIEREITAWMARAKAGEFAV